MISIAPSGCLTATLPPKRSARGFSIDPTPSIRSWQERWQRGATMGVLVKLTRETSFVAAEDVEGVGLFEPGAGLRDHDFDPVVVVRVGGVLDQAEIDHVVFDGSQTVETEMAVDDLLGELALKLGFGFEVGEQLRCEPVVGFHFIGLEHQALAGRPCLNAFMAERCLPSGVFGPVDLSALARLISSRISLRI